jgi:hypothetical protein
VADSTAARVDSTVVAVVGSTAEVVDTPAAGIGKIR